MPVAGHNNLQPIIIKKIKKGGHGHHGGAWKVAYADFVTAMMAFFLLLWLLNVTTDIERKGIADYFAPASISKSESGAGGVFGGQTITSPGAEVSASSPPGVSRSVPQPDESEEDRSESPGSGQPSGPDSKKKEDVTTGMAALAKLDEQTALPSPDKLDNKKLEEAKKKEEETFKKAEQALREAIKSSPGLAALEKNLIIDSTPEGLRIQIVDKDGYSLFPAGSARLTGKSLDLVHLVGMVLARMPNNITATGHTDNSPFPAASRRNNWQLSSARAEESLETILGAGVSPDRVMGVIGKAEREPLVKNDPSDPQNRRISIVLLRRYVDAASAKGAEAPAASSAPATSAPPAGGSPAAPFSGVTPAVPATPVPTMPSPGATH
jgi:chemotaxis protein MotB